MPNLDLATFSDALRRLSDRAIFLYTEENRSWYSTERNLNRLAADRAESYDECQVGKKFLMLLRSCLRSRRFSRVHVGVESSDLIDERTCRLVVLSPQFNHVSQATQSKALEESQNLLNQRGSSPRYRNGWFSWQQTRPVIQIWSVRFGFIAWGITNDPLDSDSKRRQATQQYESAKTTVLKNSWNLLLDDGPYPGKPDADETMNPIRLKVPMTWKSFSEANGKVRSKPVGRSCLASWNG